MSFSQGLLLLISNTYCILLYIILLIILPIYILKYLWILKFYWNVVINSILPGWPKTIRGFWKQSLYNIYIFNEVPRHQVQIISQPTGQGQLADRPLPLAKHTIHCHWRLAVNWECVVKTAYYFISLSLSFGENCFHGTVHFFQNSTLTFRIHSLFVVLSFFSVSLAHP